ncbi:MAG: radical SAM protein [bacterium]|nr:radical SAM protein [bacterium]
MKLNKPIYTRIQNYERKIMKPRLWSYPTTLLVEPTNRCNIDCVMCFRHFSHTYQIGDMAPAIFEKLVPFLPYVQEVNLQARGEPLLHNQLLTWIKQAKSAGTRVSFFTHGMLLNQAVIEQLVSIPLDLLTISLDAVSKTRFEQIRLRANFDTIIKNIRNLVEYKRKRKSSFPELHLHFVAMRLNIEELPDVLKLAKEFEVTTVVVEHLWVFDVAIIEETLFLERERMHTYFDLARKTARELNLNLVLPSEEPVKFCEPAVLKQSGLTQFEYLIENKSIPANPGDYFCLEPWRIAIVYWNGEISPCCYTDRIMGNLRQDSFQKIWNNQEYRLFRRNIRNGTLPKECINCRRLQSRKKANR